MVTTATTEDAWSRHLAEKLICMALHAKIIAKLRTRLIITMIYNRLNILLVPGRELLHQQDPHPPPVVHSSVPIDCCPSPSFCPSS